MAMLSTSSESYHTLVLLATSRVASRLYTPSTLVNATAFWPQPTLPFSAQYVKLLGNRLLMLALSIEQTLFCPPFQ